MIRSDHLRAVLVAIVSVAALIAAGTATAARAVPREIFESRCNPVLGFCWSTIYEGRNVDLVMKSENHGGTYEVCVEPPKGNEACRPVRLHRRPNGSHGGAGFRSRVVFANSFSFSGAGTYAVVWKGHPLTTPISPVLHFRLGPNGKPTPLG